MQSCRSLTLALFDTVDHPTFCRQAHPDFSPIGWHLGHIAYTEALWLLQRCGGYSPLFPEYHRLFAQGGLPKGDRVNLPTLAEVCAYLEAVRSRV
ncbi:MAG: ergothioneine biosynthesis protein EgtB, partial [Leptolyngbyaceae cyanobacterium SU_3_3]|nr:ergothioneine biosynthesis protein EgtB [Leptolyngbyaceae cyanobacterium SU_3_3]